MALDSKAATAAIARFSSSLSYDDIPEATAATVKRIILDCIGTALAATTLGDGCRETVAVVVKQGGTPQSTILGVGVQTSALQAAFANGALVHALNYDPIGGEIGHVGVICLPAPLALAEAIGKTSGRELIAAATVACEVSARVTAAISRTGRRPSEKFLSGQLLSHFGAAAGAGRMLRLSLLRPHSMPPSSCPAPISTTFAITCGPICSASPAASKFYSKTLLFKTRRPGRFTRCCARTLPCVT